MKSTLKLVREGDQVAEVSVLPLDDAGSWSPVLSVDDANKLDEVRMAPSHWRPSTRCAPRTARVPSDTACSR